MKQFWIYFSLFLIIFFVLGYRQGHEKVSQPNFIETETFEKVTIINVKNKFFMTYKTDSEDEYIFNVDSNKLVAYNPHGMAIINKPSSTSKMISGFLGNTAAGAIGGGALTYKVSDLLKTKGLVQGILKNKNQQLAIIGGVLGGASGFSLGYFTATYFGYPGDDSPEVISILRSTEKWTRSKERVFYQNYNVVQQMVNGLNDIKLKTNYKLTLRSILITLSSKTEDQRINSADFSKLFEIKNAVEPIFLKQNND